jgi:hypothetical protein
VLNSGTEKHPDLVPNSRSKLRTAVRENRCWHSKPSAKYMLNKSFGHFQRSNQSCLI